MIWLNKVLPISVLFLLIILPVVPSAAQCPTPNIQDARTTKWVNGLINFAIGDDVACRQSAPDRDSLSTRSPCNVFVGRVLARLYGIGHLTNSDGTFMKANDLATALPTSGDWEDLGIGSNQSALDAAARAANSGSVVIAVWANPTAGGYGHVAIIGPGPQSPGWGGLKVPTASAFTLDHPESAFLGKPLSCAFGSNKKEATHLWRYKGIAVQR